MTRRRVLVVLAGLTATRLGSSLVHAVDPAPEVVRLGYVQPQSQSNALRGMTAFWERLRQLGYVEGKNLVITSRSAEGRNDRLPGLMNELVAKEKIDDQT